MEPLTHRIDRRGWLKITGLAGAAGAGWLGPVAQVLAQREERARGTAQAQSVILLWMQGGPSQLETFDPHPGAPTGGPTKDIATVVPAIRLAKGLERVAEQMNSISLVRSLVTKEGDHERGTYLVKTGYSPDPTAVHPAIGAIICKELPEELPSGLRTEIPRHVAILPGQWPGRGGELGDNLDAFKTYDPRQKVPDVTARVDQERFEQRLRDLSVVESQFSQGRKRQVNRTLHGDTVQRATRMMTSDQLQAFEIAEEPRDLLARYGDTPFGRACLAARRLIAVGVRCVEVTLAGWDTHVSNFEGTDEQKKLLDPALAALIADLQERGLLKSTVVLCGGEFGRTPKINPTDGRDHWPQGFSFAVAGGGLRGGTVIGATDPDGDPKKVVGKHGIEDLHATVLAALGINFTKEYISRTQRPIQYSSGETIGELLGDRTA
ncbi:MAG: DUF1501 domain-containing protein [Planctomycetia bacterium]|nr:DUF1501 domain-containing protein [Planctomycetia bacterium]